MTLIIAHRGDSSRAPENTMASFRLAIEEGADGIELDVQLTSDGEAVICHDEKVDRTTDGIGYIKDMSYREIRTLNAGKGEKIPHLAEVIELIKDKGKLLNVELKNSIVQYRGLEKKVINIIEKYDMVDNVILSSFNHYSLRTVRDLLPSMKIGLLYAAGLIDPWEIAEKVGGYSLHPFYPNVTPQLVFGCHAHNIKLFPWTVNDRPTMEMFLKLGVDAIITNDPLLLKETADSLK